MTWKKRIVLKRISTYVILICLGLTLILAGFSVYGTKAGNYVIDVANLDVKLALSMNEDRSNTTERLTTEGLTKQDNGTYADIPTDIAEGIGSKNDLQNRRYIAFSFWLLNLSDRAVDYTMRMRLRDAKKDVENAVRVMIVSEDDFLGAAIYGRAEADEETQSFVEQTAGYYYRDFAADDVICEEEVTNFARGGAVKYTVVVWLEGWDPDCTNDIKGGSIKMSLHFAGR